MTDKVHRFARRKAGICADCSKSAIDGHCRCKDCQDQVNQAARMVRKARIQDGICTSCGKRKAVKGVQTCRRCRADANAEGKKYRDRHRAAGLCLQCKKKPVKDKTLCKAHLKRQVANIATIRRNRVNKGICHLCGKRKAAKGIQTCRKCTPLNLEWAAEQKQAIDERKKLVPELLKGIDILTGRHRRVIELRYGLTGQRPLGWKAIARLEGVTHEAIRQCEVIALRAIATGVAVRRGPRIQDSVNGSA